MKRYTYVHFLRALSSGILETTISVVIRQSRERSRSLDDDFALTRRELVNVPVIGTVAAGVPILAEQNIEDYLPIPAEILPNKEVFMLKVKETV